MEKKAQVVALDGPSGSGKSTLALRLAQELDYLYIDTGAMFRALAWYLDRAGVMPEDETAVSQALQQLNLDYDYRDTQGATSSPLSLAVNGEEVSQLIRSHQVSDLASRYSTNPAIRRYLLDFQRQLAQQRPCVMEGRDIGTVVFPDAFAKFFVVAEPPIRAQRRLRQLQEKGRTELTQEQVLADVLARDQRDSQRAHAPLMKAADAETIATDQLSVDQTVELLLKKITDKRKKKEWSPPGPLAAEVSHELSP